MSHLRIAEHPENIQATRVDKADLVLGSDIVVTASSEGLQKIDRNRTHVIVNKDITITGHFTQNPNYVFPEAAMIADLEQATSRIDYIDATALATALMGDSITTNLFLVGYALQKGLIPVSPEAVQEAIRLNEVAVKFNLLAFNWGRLAAADRQTVEGFIHKENTGDKDHKLSETLSEKIQRRYDFLIDYQDKNYADRYLSLVRRVETAESKLGLTGLTEVVAQSYYRLMAVKDEYEVARLYTNGDFKRRLAAQFEGDYKLQFHLAPPIFTPKDPHTGHLIKTTYGGWMMHVFRFLAKCKRLRGTVLDIFSYSAERKMERQLIVDFEAITDQILRELTAANHSIAIEQIALFQKIKGFGHVKLRGVEEIKKGIIPPTSHPRL